MKQLGRKTDSAAAEENFVVFADLIWASCAAMIKVAN